MDDTDRRLLIQISADPRIHSRELAKRLGISRQTVQQRMQVLTKNGAIKGITAGISVYYLDAVYVIIFGKSNTASIEETLNRLGESEFTRSAIVAGGNFLYVGGLLRNISELDSYAKFVKRAAEMPAPTVGIYCLDDGIMPENIVDGGRRKQSYKKLTSLDLKIIASLKDNARRPIAEIADRVGVSAKTVRRHLEGMTSGGSLEFDVPWDLLPGGDMFTLMHVNLREGADKGEVGRRLFSMYPLLNVYIRSFSNLPSFLLCILWSDKMTEMRKVLREIGEDEDVLTVTPNLLYLEHTYATWRDKLPEVQTRSSEKARTHKLHSRLRTQ
jgi:DNA-binding Lrp family transcriptional regulator